MNRKKRIIINLLILMFLCVCVFGIQGEIRFTPFESHKLAERKSYYGPSKIINTINHGDEVIYVSEYDKWNSIDIAKRNKFRLWRQKNFPNILEKKNNEPFTAQFFYERLSEEKSKMYEWIIWGVINDENIKDVKLISKCNGKLETFEENNMKDGTFVFFLESNNEYYEDSDLIVVGLDSDKNTIYKVNYRGHEYK